MTIATMPAAQKLLRLKHIAQRLREQRKALLALPVEEYSGPVAEMHRLEAEHDAILASVGAPPLELIGSTDAHAWATAFTGQFPYAGLVDVYGWFANAILAGAQEGFADGVAQGRAAALQERTEASMRDGQALEAMAHALETIRDGIAAGAIKCRSSIATTNEGPGATVQTLAEFVADALAKAGR